jgi:hypothetical protein
MPGIKGLNKGDRPDTERRAEDFISGASVQNTRGTGQRFRRYTFSLTPQVSAEIDQLSLVPREFRTSRSDVVKAGVEALKRLPKADLVTLLREVVGM